MSHSCGRRSAAFSERLIAMSSRNPSTSQQSQVELDLLDAILLGDDENYPWNPLDRESSVRLTKFEERLEIDDLEIGDRYPVFFQHLNACWLHVQLRQKFGARVPQDILDAIAHQAAQLMAGNLSLADLLVRCVHGLIPNWSIEDLQVLARPFAYAMRGKTPESVSESVRSAPWMELSTLERARLSLAVAHFTLLNLRNDV
ncbi:MAG: hypothetical protein J7641_20355 [Cyanobacteria bacterium SID2]|nr:hypothetical protein [Cyanobacteria bacterium SID2]